MAKKSSEDQERERCRHHIEELTKKIDSMEGGNVSMGFSPDFPDAEREKFLMKIVAMEGLDERPLFDILVEAGVDMPPAEELDDTRLEARLWEVIHAMEEFGHYLQNTDHLSDRDLYKRLWTETLREPTSVMPENPRFACFIDIVGTGSVEDLRLYLKYYADEETRREWAKDWAWGSVPEHEDPPYDRDRRLPGAF